MLKKSKLDINKKTPYIMIFIKKTILVVNMIA